MIPDHVITALLRNVDHYKEVLREEILQRAELLKYEDIVFHKDIEEQFSDIVKLKLTQDMSKTFGLSSEDCLIILEETQYVELIKC